MFLIVCNTDWTEASAAIGGNDVYSISLVYICTGCPVASLTAGLNSVPITENLSVMSCESSIRERLRLLS